MSEFNSNDINDAKRRVEEMRKKANNYIDTPQNEDKTFKNSSAKSNNKNDSPLSFRRSPLVFNQYQFPRKSGINL